MNMNRANIIAEAYREANEIWDLGKVIGLIAKQHDEDIIQVLVGIEEWDRDQSKAKNVSREEAGVNKVT